ncbi:hypothetical protein GCM10025867_51040 (plasmid) [Frondihabitans sucicola]|uniref:Uncharacterized protein n=1 Tax=Frondihabitans sucicola TaxID=1268041 RepID=A0ABN6Y4Q1_9MICO|nr:hypothetical protein [Frondihabitans sucicola]BDZ52297.1 hypothetical protein GCM10025867_45380 [Frondihabitans sucicola]BDZ52863.1 hypothetical protein GCM10025867_51040 [Frondihabitans sucicola]
MIILLAAAASRAFKAFAPAVPTPILWLIIGLAVAVNLIVKGRIVIADNAAERADEAARTGTPVAYTLQRPKLTLKGFRRLLPVDAATLGGLAIIIGALHFLPEQ